MLLNECVYIFILNVFSLTDANSTEFDPETKHPVVGVVLVKQMRTSA